MEQYANLDDLISNLEKIKEEGHGSINFTQAIYLLAKQIQEIKYNTHGIKRNNGGLTFRS